MTLPMMVRSGRTPVSSWAPPSRHAEAADDLVEDQQRAGRGGALAQELEEARLRADEAHVGRIGLGQDRGELVLLGGAHERVGVVPRHDDRRCGGCFA